MALLLIGVAFGRTTLQENGSCFQLKEVEHRVDDQKIHFLNVIGSEIDKVITYLDELKKEKLKKCKKKLASPASLGNGVPIEIVQNLKKLRNIKLA